MSGVLFAIKRTKPIGKWRNNMDFWVAYLATVVNRLGVLAIICAIVFGILSAFFAYARSQLSLDKGSEEDKRLAEKGLFSSFILFLISVLAYLFLPTSDVLKLLGA